MKKGTGEFHLVVRLSLLGEGGGGSCCRTVWRRRPALGRAIDIATCTGQQSVPCCALWAPVVAVFVLNVKGGAVKESGLTSSCCVHFLNCRR